MRTKQELAMQARQLEERANRLWAEHRRQEVLSPSSASAEAVTLFEFPGSSARFVSPGKLAPTEIHHFVRRIEYTPEEIGPMYTIVEEESAHDLKGQLLRRYEPMPLVVTNRAMEDRRLSALRPGSNPGANRAHCGSHRGHEIPRHGDT